jgi:hypothetical protein
LVDSIFKNYPIHAFIAIRHLVVDGDEVTEFCNIEDGQTRMTALQEYMLDGYHSEAGDAANDGKLYSELEPVMKERFKNYQVTLEVFSVPQRLCAPSTSTGLLLKRFAWKSKVGMECPTTKTTAILISATMDLEMAKDLEMVLLLAMISILHHPHSFLNLSKIRGCGSSAYRLLRVSVG